MVTKATIRRIQDPSFVRRKVPDRQDAGGKLNAMLLMILAHEKKPSSETQKPTSQKQIPPDRKSRIKNQFPSAFHQSCSMLQGPKGP
jgi:hypothetical protein